MIRTGSIPKPVPDALPLDRAGRMFLLAFLHADLASGVPVTVDSWRTAYGLAADYQTVVNAKAVLAS